MVKNRNLAIALGCLIVFASQYAQAQTSAFSYQGILSNNGAPATGSFDLQFKLFDALTGGLQQGSTITKNAVTVTNGIFAVVLDFGSSALPGSNRFLELSVQTAGGSGFTTLAPRSQILSAPYAVSALNAQTAGTAQTVTGPISGSSSTATLSVNNSAGGIPPDTGIPPSALTGSATGSGGQTIGLRGSAIATNGIGVLGDTGGSGGGGAPSVGVFGVATSTSGPANGVMGETSSSNGWGVYGNARATTGPANGIVGDSSSPNGSALVGRSFGTADILTLTSTVAGGNPKLRVLASGDFLSLGNINATKGFRTATGAFSAGGTPEVPNFSADFQGNVITNGTLVVATLGTAGATALCRNATNQISSCSSSLRYKTNIGRFDAGMSFVRQLRPISFNWKDGWMRDVGFGAEDIAKVDPRFVTYNSSGEVEGVKYDRLSVAFVNAFKEQQTQIEAQEKKISEQDALLKKQQSELDALKKIVCSQNASADICKE